MTVMTWIRRLDCVRVSLSPHLHSHNSLFVTITIFDPLSPPRRKLSIHFYFLWLLLLLLVPSSRHSLSHNQN